MDNTYEDRNSIPSEYKWDLDSIYKTKDAYYKDVELATNKIKEITSYKGRVLESSNNLLDVLEGDLNLSLILDKMVNYVHLNSELDTRNAEFDKMMQELELFYANMNYELNFISEELKSLTNEMLNKFLEENSDLKPYEFGLRCTIKNNKHLLSLENENLLSKLSPVLGAGEEISSKLDDADSDYGYILDKDGNKLKLTGGTFSEYVTSMDRVLRKNADEAMHEYYKKHANTFSACLTNHIKTHSIMANLRGYNSSLEASLNGDNIDEEFYRKFISDVNKNLDTLHKMMSLYKKAFKLSDMHIYDARVKYSDGVKTKYTIDEMKDILLKALSPLGEEYINGVKEAFNNNWVDYYETPGKRSGAFSTTALSVKPYLLLNYTGSFDDLETFAHELGHSMHTYFANKYRTPIDANYPIFLAEIASTTNELLLNNYLLNSSNDVNLKRYILNNLLSMYRATVFRQAEFAEFEMIVYDKVDKGENLSRDDYTNIYYDLQKKYYGEDVIQDDYIRYECFRIPHFYYNFYVYKYATSLALAYRFAYAIINNEAGAVENYLNFLKSGGKDYPLNILKECGIDVNHENILDYSLKMINNYMSEFEKLI